MSRLFGRTVKTVALAAVAIVGLTACGGGCSNDNKRPGNPDVAVVDTKGGEHTINQVTVQVPEGAVSANTTLKVSPPRALPVNSSPLQGAHTPPAVQFDVSLGDGQVQPASGKPLTLRIPLTGEFVPAGADPRNALMYTTLPNGAFALLDSEVQGEVLVVTTPHLSPKTVAYLTQESIEEMLASGALEEVKDECAKRETLPPLQELKITKDAPDNAVRACLVTKKSNLYLRIYNNSPIMWGVKGSQGTSVVPTVDSFNTEAVKLLRGNLYPGNTPQGILAHDSHIDTKVNGAKLPATIEVRPHLRLVNAELAWKAMQLWLQIKSGKKESYKDLEKYLVTIPGLEECLTKAIDLQPHEVIGMVFSECGDQLGKLAIEVLGDEAAGWVKIDRWWNRIQAVGGAVKDGWNVTVSGAVTAFEKFGGKKIDIVVGLANPCLSKSQFSSMGRRLYNSVSRYKTYPGDSVVSRQGIRCKDGWALVEEMAVFTPSYGEYAIAWGPILLHYNNGTWEAAGLYASPFDGGAEPRMIHSCKSVKGAPRDFRATINCR